MDKFYNDNSALLDNWYHKDNILVKDISNGDKCYVFFSSNNIFYPNTVEAFDRQIIKMDRYEWVHIAQSPEFLNGAGRMIFVRDLFKQWYVGGISSEVNSHDKLIEKLRNLTKGYRVVTVGSSAGGYMAMLVGALLDAEMCFDFSGHTVLDEVDPEYCQKECGCEPVSLPYYEIDSLIRNSKCRFFYFYPVFYDEDRRVYERISCYDNVYGFGFNQSHHAATMMAGNMRYIVCKDVEYMERLYEKYKDKVINYILFFFCTAPIYAWFPVGIRETKSFIKRKINSEKG